MCEPAGSGGAALARLPMRSFDAWAILAVHRVVTVTATDPDPIT